MATSRLSRAPWGTTRTFDAATQWCWWSSSLAACDWTTSTSATRASRSIIIRWLGEGVRRTVWRITITGAVIRSTTSRTSTPSGPPKMPNSCWTIATSNELNARAADKREPGSRGTSSSMTSEPAEGALRRSMERTTPDRTPPSPASIIALRNAAVNVAIPHRVGG